MSVLLKSEELAKDVAGAEALLQRHNEHKVCTHNKVHYCGLPKGKV